MCQVCVERALDRRVPMLALVLGQNCEVKSRIKSGHSSLYDFSIPRVVDSGVGGTVPRK